MIGTKIEEIINPQTYQLLITQDQEIRLSPHALDHLSEGQRQPKTAEELIHTLKKETPVLAGKQGNGRYAAYFKRKDHYLKIIFNKTNNIEIVTFINTQNIPRKTR